jgi:glutamate--cysteine ligase
MESPHEWSVPGYEDLELSTQMLIREAMSRGNEVEVLDRNANFIRITGKGKVEYVRQATRTSQDSYIAPLIMENKKVTKLILDEAGIRVPKGRDYDSLSDMEADWGRWKEARSVVVKPNSTNFGIAVAILAKPFTMEDFLWAGEAAFAEDDCVIAEEYVSGKEYRFLVIDGITRAILHRVPANVTGDGKSTIERLMEKKNEDPRRGEGYRSPLERLREDDEEERFLRAQGLSFSSIPERGKTVYLRKNSNISTGGDSIDFTDTMHPGYKDIAAAAAAAVGAKICGVDMMVSGVDDEPTGTNYGIIELNFNPALHIHDFPHEGKNRAVEKYVLDLLEL